MSIENLTYREAVPFERLAAAAAAEVATGDPDKLVVPQNHCPVLPGEQDDDGVRAIAAIDVLRFLVGRYEEHDRPDALDKLVVEYRTWREARADQSANIEDFDLDDMHDLEEQGLDLLARFVAILSPADAEPEYAPNNQ